MLETLLGTVYLIATIGGYTAMVQPHNSMQQCRTEASAQMTNRDLGQRITLMGRSYTGRDIEFKCERHRTRPRAQVRTRDIFPNPNR